MRKTPPISIDKIALAFLFAFQAIQYTRAGIMLDSSPLGWMGGVCVGIGSALVVVITAAKAPRIKHKIARRATWGMLAGLALVAPVVVGITNYQTIVTAISGFWRILFAVAFATIPDFLIAVLAFASGSLLPAQSEVVAKPVQAKAIEPITFNAVCPRCNWSHNHYTSQRAATNALTAHGKVHK